MCRPFIYPWNATFVWILPFSDSLISNYVLLLFRLLPSVLFLRVHLTLAIWVTPIWFCLSFFYLFKLFILFVYSAVRHDGQHIKGSPFYPKPVPAPESTPRKVPLHTASQQQAGSYMRLAVSHSELARVLFECSLLAIAHQMPSWWLAMASCGSRRNRVLVSASNQKFGFCFFSLWRAHFLWMENSAA